MLGEELLDSKRSSGSTMKLKVSNKNNKEKERGCITYKNKLWQNLDWQESPNLNMHFKPANAAGNLIKPLTPPLVFWLLLTKVSNNKVFTKYIKVR